MEALTEGKKLNRSFWIKIAIWVVLVAGIWNIPPSGALTPAGMHCLGVFVGMLYGLIVLKQFVLPTLGSMVLMAFSGCYSGLVPAFKAGFASDSFIMIFSVSLITTFIAHFGMVRILALKMLNAKFASRRPWRLTFIILLTTAALSLFMDALVVVPVMATLIIEIFRGCGIKRMTRWTSSLLVGMTALSATTQNIMPFQVGPSVNFGILTGFNEAFSTKNFAPQLIIAGACQVVLIFALFFLFIYLFAKNDVDDVINYVPSPDKFAFNGDQRISFWFLVFFIVFNIIGYVFPEGALRTALLYPGLPGWACITIILVCLLRRKNGEDYISFNDLGRKLNWFVLLMMIAVGVVCDPMATEVTGILTWLSDIITPIVQSVGPYGCFAILVLFCIIMTNLADNFAVFFMAGPIIYVACQATGMNTVGIMAVAIIAMQCGVATPAATPHIALIYGHCDTGYVQRQRIMALGWVFALLTVIVLLTIGWLVQGIYPYLG